MFPVTHSKSWSVPIILIVAVTSPLLLGNRAFGDTVYDGIFANGHADQKLWVGAYWEPFLSNWQRFEKEGYRLVDFEVDTTGSRRKFSGVFEPGGYSPAAYIGRPWKEFHEFWQKMEKKQYRLIDIETWRVKGKRVYGGVFAPGKYRPAGLRGQNLEGIPRDLGLT